MQSIVSKVCKYLIKKNHTISFAESCTGGRIAAAFTSLSGISAVFNGSVVSYSNEIKQQWLGVKKSTLEQNGAVSRECVSEMLDGIVSISDYAIAVSGIAGPTGGTKQKPVGTVFIGIVTPNKKVIDKCHFDGDRNAIQEQATLHAIRLLAKHLA